MLARILAPVDGCEGSEAVLPYVKTLTSRLHCHVTLLHVFPSSLHAQREAHVRYVEALATRLRNDLTHTAVDIVGLALEGKPNREITNYASRPDIGLVATSPHSQSSEGHWSIGRTADKVIRETSKPVLLVGADDKGSPAHRELMSHVLVPLDGSRESRAVLALVEGILPGAQDDEECMVWLLHVIPAAHYAAGPVIAKRVPYSREEEEELRTQATRYLEEVAMRIRGRGKRVQTRVASGDAALMILETATMEGANLIAMTTHGYSGFSRLFLGSVAERVLHNATVPLLLVKPERY